MSLDTLLQDYRQRDVVPPRESSVGIAERAEKVFDMSVQKNISTDEADAEILVGELIDHNAALEGSPIYQDMDNLIDVFDPSEPPKVGEGIPDPLGELLKLELATARESVKWTMKAMSFVFSPIDRAFKFVTNAAMYDPLTKSAVGPVKKLALNTAIHFERLDRLAKYREKNNLRPGAKIPDEAKEKIFREIDETTVDLIKRVNAEKIEPVTLGEFGKSAQDALKALIPWPGAAKDVKSFGEVSADSYRRIVGRDAPNYYAVVADIALQTTALIGLSKIATSSQAAIISKDVAAGAKLTKSEVRAIRRLHKAALQAKKLPVKSTTVPSSTDAATASQKMIRLIKEAKSLRPKKALLVHRNRQKQAAKLAQVQKNVQGQRLVKSTRGALKGKAPTPDFEPINVLLSSQEQDVLFNLINNSQLGVGFAKGRGILSLDKLLHGELITKSEIANLELVFGKQLTKALFKKQSISSIIQDVSFEVINLPRAILASFDLSAAGRQGIIFSISHPVASMKAFGRSVRAAASLKYADDIERVTRASKFGQMGDRFGIHSSPTGFTAKIVEKEEVYLSRIAEKIPGIAASERAFTTFLNQQRREVFALQAKRWIKKGITPDKNAKSYQQLAAFINHATGRGSLETIQPGALTALNATFFSPRFQVSRVQVIGDLISPKTTIHARKVIARDLAEYYATGMGVMAMAKAGGAEIEDDPRSSDFGKIKVGNTRYNYWGAFQPMASLAGRIYSGEIKSTGTGKIKDKSRIGIIGAFLRTKLAPVPGRLIDIGLGETVLGDPVEPTLKFIGKATFESLAPLSIQDSIDAWRFQGADAQFPLSAGLAFIGIGVQTWEIAPFAELELAKDSLARQTFGKNYDQLSFSEVSMLDRDILVNHPGIVDLERQVKFESDGVNFLKKQAQELRKSERFLEKKIDKKLLADLNEIKLSIGGVDRIFGNWRLNDEQYKEYQQKVAVNINKLFKDMKPLWDTKSTEGKYELMSVLLRSAKLLATDEMKIGDME